MTTAATRPTADRRAWQLLRQPDFRRLWCSRTVSLFGDEVSVLALPLAAVLVLHAGAGQMGLLTAAGMAPNLLFSLHAGAFSDRHGRRRATMVVADLARAGLLASVPIAALLGRLSLAQLYLVAFGVGTMGTLFTVADASLFVAVVQRDRTRCRVPKVPPRPRSRPRPHRTPRPLTRRPRLTDGSVQLGGQQTEKVVVPAVPWGNRRQWRRTQRLSAGTYSRSAGPV